MADASAQVYRDKYASHFTFMEADPSIMPVNKVGKKNHNNPNTSYVNIETTMETN